MNIRPAQQVDRKSIQKVIEAAFPVEEHKVILNFVAELLLENSKPPIQSLIAEINNEIIGYASFSPIFLHPESKVTGYILAPLAVAPKHQKKGIGSSLINTGKQILSGVDVLLVYGDPDYYRRFGFKAEIAQPFVPPYLLKYPFGWLGMNITGITLDNTAMKFCCVDSLAKPELW